MSVAVKKGGSRMELLCGRKDTWLITLVLVQQSYQCSQQVEMLNVPLSYDMLYTYIRQGLGFGIFLRVLGLCHVRSDDEVEDFSSKKVALTLAFTSLKVEYCTWRSELL